MRDDFETGLEGDGQGQQGPAHHEIERQPFSNYSAISVPPRTKSTIRLSGGRTIPYIYQLGVNSTCPFVRLLGGSGSQKLISWNEKIEVAPGTMVTLENASFHRGDIWVNSGWDPSAIPARVTVPVEVNAFAGPIFTSAFPCDTRRARRAFLAGPKGTAGAASIDIVGEARQRSHSIGNAPTEGPNPVPQYGLTISFPPATTIGLIPLGENAGFDDTVHSLLDLVNFTTTGIPGATASGAWHYVLEYA